MIRFLPALTAALVAATPSLPQAPDGPLSAEAFEQFVEGRSFTHFSGGEPYAIEAYFPGRRTIWLVFGEACMQGEWFPRDDFICFVYEDDPEQEHCWHYLARGEDELVARFEGNPVGQIALVDDGEPLTCPGFGA